MERYTGPDGRVVHAMVAAGPVRFAVKDADAGDPAPGAGGVPVIMALYVADADDGRPSGCSAAGATVIFEIADQRLRRLRRPARRPVRAPVDDRAAHRRADGRSRSQSPD